MTMKLIKITLTLLYGLGLGACNQTEPPETSRTQQPDQAAYEITILALGDSLTEGLGVTEKAAYPAVLQQLLKQSGYSGIKVVNAGLSGETSNGLKNRVDWVLQLEPDLTVLNIGANDAMRGLDVKQTEANIRYIVETLRESGSDVILAGMEIYNNLGREYVSGFKAMYPRIAKDMDLPLIPFFLKGVAGSSQLNQTDGIHPNAEGYQIIVKDNVLPAVKHYLEQHKF